MNFITRQVYGYYQARTFYTPKYDIPQSEYNKPDLRTTIYWDPNVVTDKDGNMITTANIVREWYVNGVLKASGTNVLSGPFVHKDIITYKVTADGVVSDSIQWTIWCQYSC